MTNHSKVFSQEYDQYTLYFLDQNQRNSIDVDCPLSKGHIWPVNPSHVYILIDEPTLSPAHSSHWTSHCYQGAGNDIKLPALTTITPNTRAYQRTS